MSEENVPKLRLKPKLAPDPIPAQLEPVSDPAPAETPAAEEPKGFRLKPRLLPPTEQSSEFVQSQESVPLPPESEAPPVFEAGLPPAAAEEEKPARKFALKPKSLEEPFAAEQPPVTGDVFKEHPLLPPDYVDRKDQAIGEIGAVPPALTARPFPPPPANFPPPSGGGVRPPPPWVRASGASNRGGRLVQIGATAIIVLVVLGGVFFAYQKFNPTAPGVNGPSHPAVVESAPNEPAAETAVPGEADSSAASVPEAQTAQTPAQPVPVVVKAAPVVPPASPAFKHWVEDLRVGGVRAGSTTRVFIGGTAYATGDVVNQQLGIIFDSYNPETRHLVFRDKSGAVVEKRN